jgi:cytochrome c
VEGMTKIFLLLATLAGITLPLIHPFGPVRQQSSSAMLPGDAAVRPLLERACANCHSEQTKWPLYSQLPLLSWAIEKDVAEAREHMNLSHWEQFSAEQKRDLLARIGTELRSRQMPLPRYLVLHPEARLSDAEIQAIYEWTKSERRKFRE